MALEFDRTRSGLLSESDQLAWCHKVSTTPPSTLRLAPVVADA